MTNGNISIEQVDPETERASISRLLEANLPDAATKGRFEWAYLENPHGAAKVWLARTEDGDAIGTSAAFPRLFRVNGNAVKALVLSDFAFDARHRTLGPALKLLRASLAPVDAGEFKFALDHPSESMAAVYRRLGGTELGPQVRFVRLLGIAGLVRRRWGNGPLVSSIGRLGDAVMGMLGGPGRVAAGLAVADHSGPYDASFAEVAGVLETRRSVVGDRSPDYLNWRFHSGIRFRYATVTVSSAGKLLAYAILQHTDDRVATIAEFVCPPDRAAERALLSAVADHCRRNNAESIQASGFDGGAWSVLLNDLGFAARERLPGVIVYACKGEEIASTLAAGKSWWMTDGDRDG